MRRRDFLISCGLIPVAGCAGFRARARGAESIDVQALAGLVPGLLAEFNVPGAAVACVQRGRMTYCRGFGLKDSQSKAPVDDDTLFEAASVSKTVFAYAALKLCENGLIDLDKPLSRYTKKLFVEGDSRLDKITPRHVLSHSAGFAEWRSNDKPLIQSEPGSAFQYSGEGYFYLQSVITELAGSIDPTQCGRYEADFEVCATDFAEFMQTNLLEPFRMSHSGYLLDGRRAHQMASAHNTQGMPIIKDWPRRSDVARYGAVGGLNMTASDYAKFLIETLEPQEPDHYRLSHDMRREMVRPQIQLPKGGQIDGCSAWGLGWGIQEREAGNLLVHSGGQSGFRSLALASLEKKSGLIILTNSDNGGSVIFSPKFLTVADRIVTGG